MNRHCESSFAESQAALGLWRSHLDIDGLFKRGVLLFDGFSVFGIGSIGGGREALLLAGILILLFRPFGIDDQISVTGLEGRVVNIDLRYTVLPQPDKLVLIPNSNLFTNPILVNSKRTGTQAT